MIGAAVALLALATSAPAVPGDVTAIVRVDCRVSAADTAPHQLVGYVFTPDRVVRVTHDFGAASSGSFTTTRESAPVEASVLQHLVATIATPRFYAPHAYRDLSRNARFSDRRLAVRRAGTTSIFAIEEPVGTADRQFSYRSEIVFANAVYALGDVTWTPVSGGFDPFALCTVPRSSLGHITGAAVSHAVVPSNRPSSHVTEITVADCHFGFERAGGSDLSGFVLTPDGRAVRATTAADQMKKGTTPGTFETAQIGADAYRAIAKHMEASSFFVLSRSNRFRAATDTRGTRVSGVRGMRRITWSSEVNPSDRIDTIESAIRAVLEVTSARPLRWVRASVGPDPFAICRQPVQRYGPPSR